MKQWYVNGMLWADKGRGGGGGGGNCCQHGNMFHYLCLCSGLGGEPTLGGQRRGHEVIFSFSAASFIESSNTNLVFISRHEIIKYNELLIRHGNVCQWCPVMQPIGLVHYFEVGYFAPPF